MDSPVAVAVFTNMRKVLTILVSIVLFEQGAIETLNIVGMIITFVGVGVYTIQELRNKEKKRRLKVDGRENIV